MRIESMIHEWQPDSRCRWQERFLENPFKETNEMKKWNGMKTKKRALGKETKAETNGGMWL